jgi:hypothetical protein
MKSEERMALIVEDGWVQETIRKIKPDLILALCIKNGLFTFDDYVEELDAGIERERELVRKRMDKG